MDSDNIYVSVIEFKDRQFDDQTLILSTMPRSSLRTKLVSLSMPWTKLTR